MDITIYRLTQDLFFTPRGTLFIQHPDYVNRYYPESAYDVEANEDTGKPHLTDLYGFTKADVEGHPELFEPVYSTVKLDL